MKRSKLLDSGRKRFPTNSQWTDIYCLSSLPCSVQQRERIILFIFPKNLVVLGIRRYQTSLCQVSPAPRVDDLTLSLQIRSVLCTRPWHSYKRNSLSPKLLSMPPDSPLPLLCSFPQRTTAAMLNANTDSPPRLMATSVLNLQLRFSSCQINLVLRSTSGMLNALSRDGTRSHNTGILQC